MIAERQSAENFLGRWARFAVRNRGKVLIGWLVGLVVVVALSRAVGGTFANSFSIPGSESQRAQDLLQARFPQQAGDSATIVFQDSAGLKDPAVQSRVTAVLAQAKSLPGAIAVGSPYQPGQGALSADGTIGYANVQYAKKANDIPKSDSDALLKLVDGAKGNGLAVEAGGQIVENGEQSPPGSSE